MDTPVYIIGDPETAGGTVRDFTNPKTNFVNAVIYELEKIQSFNTDIGKSEANQMYNLPGAEHLNPKLIASVIIFQKKTKYKPIEEMNRKTFNTNIKNSLNYFFSDISSGSNKYLLLKGDMIRYIKLVEDYIERN